MRGILQCEREVSVGRKLIDKTKAMPLLFCQGVCGPCRNQGQWRRQNTAYWDDERNWWFLCEECQKEADEYWDDMWSSVPGYF